MGVKGLIIIKLSSIVVGLSLTPELLFSGAEFMDIPLTNVRKVCASYYLICQCTQQRYVFNIIFMVFSSRLLLKDSWSPNKQFLITICQSILEWMIC